MKCIHESLKISSCMCCDPFNWNHREYSEAHTCVHLWVSITVWRQQYLGVKSWHTYHCLIEHISLSHEQIPLSGDRVLVANIHETEGLLERNIASWHTCYTHECISECRGSISVTMWRQRYVGIELWHTYQWVMVYISLNHGIHVNESWPPYQRVIAQISTSHGTHVIESWHFDTHMSAPREIMLFIGKPMGI